jgi:hypothetical protein
MPALLALALCDACSQPQAQGQARPAEVSSASASATLVPQDATAPASPRSVDDARASTPVDHSSNRQPRTNAH